MKYAMVTGGSRGIGRACCLQLAEMGYNVIINYARNQEAAEETRRLVEEKGVTAELMPFDVADGAAADAAVTAWQEQHPDDYIAILVNNAGIRQDTMLVFMEDRQWHDVLNTTLNGFFYITRRVVKDMLTKRWGRIVNVVSLSGIKGLPGQVNYSAAKAGVIGAVKALAVELAKRGITVNAVAPGVIETEMAATIEFQDEVKKAIPMRRFGTPEEVAGVVAFLFRDEAAYVTRQVISVNGGLF